MGNEEQEEIKNEPGWMEVNAVLTEVRHAQLR